MKSVNRYTRFIVMASVLVALLLASATPAPAGSNGQQIRVNNVCYAQSVRIIGDNQDHKRQDKSYTADPNNCITIETKDWWWRGTVYVTAIYPDTTYQRVITNVPPQQNTNWWDVTIPTISNVVLRGYTWVQKPVVYGIVFNNGVDPNPDDNYYSAVKDKYSRSVKDNSYYRTDCSGFVSYAWNLDTSKDTVELGRYAEDIKSYSDLQPGNIINNKQSGAYGHVILFVRWIDKNNNEFWAYEESGGQGKTVLSTIRLVINNKGQIVELKKLNSKGDSFYSYGNGPWFAQRKP